MRATSSATSDDRRARFQQLSLCVEPDSSTVSVEPSDSVAEMASLLQPDRVVYLVRGEKKLRAPLSQLYFCRYCSELRSLECVSHEVRGRFRRL